VNCRDGKAVGEESATKPGNATAGRPRLSIFKKLLFSGIVAVAVFLALELALAIAGWKPMDRQEDPYVGFLATEPLFVESMGDGGEPEMVTAANRRRWFNAQRFPKKKGQNSFRIFCLGGSTTYGHPYDDNTSFAGWLRELLPAADSSRKWEVINAGGISYASYRVANVMDELLAYDPDLCIIYTGHNEFLEARTYPTLKALPQFAMTLDRLCGRTRVYAAMSRLVRGERQDVNGRDTGDRGDLLPAEVNTLLDSAVGLEAYHRDDDFQRGVVEHFAFNLRRMAMRARAAGVAVIFVTPASNLADCSPFKSEPLGELDAASRQAWGTAYSVAEQQFRASQPRDALAAVSRAVGIDGRHAAGLYLRGQVRHALDDFEGARQDYSAARDEDVCTLRAPTAIIEAVRSTAAACDVLLVDFVSHVERVSPHRIPGANVFLDHVHPTIDGYRDLAVLLIIAMQAQGIITTSRLVPPDAIEAATSRVMSRVDSSAHGTALLNLSKVLSWAGKKEEADRLAQKAIELIPDNPDAEYQAANAFVRQGDLDEGIRRFLRVIELAPHYAPAAHAALGFAFSRKGDEAQSIEHYRRALELNPNFADVHYNLGTILEKRGQLDAAAEHYQQAITGNPQHVTAWHRLGIVFARGERWAAAVAHLNQALQLDPNSVEIHLHLGEILARQGDGASAREQFAWILRRFPDHAAARTALQQLER